MLRIFFNRLLYYYHLVLCILFYIPLIEHYANDQFAYVIVIYTTEFQKRGLTHTHILVFLHPEAKNQIADFIDNFIFVGIPDSKIDPVGYKEVKNFMMHSPYGLLTKDAQCMEKVKCIKHFPKKIVE